jgi:hypothetical protein
MSMTTAPGELRRGDDPSPASQLADGARARTGREQADAWAAAAREHWGAGRLAEAAAYNHACRQADPERTPLWRARAAKLLVAAGLQSLATQNAVRLAVAGITAADPGAGQIRDWNAQITNREAGQ